MKKCKKIIFLAMLFVMMASMFSTNVYAALPRPTAQELFGRYSFNKETGKLVISTQLTLDAGAWRTNYGNELKSVRIGEKIHDISGYIFWGCENLKEINVDENHPSYKSIDGVLFSKDGTELIRYPIRKDGDNYTIPDSVTSIDLCAFNGCTNLTSVTIPDDSVTEIGESAFEKCTGLKEITIPASVEVIGKSAFDSCTGLASITISEGVRKIGGYAFSECESLTGITIPASVTEINEYAFAECPNLKSVTYLGKRDPFVDSSEYSSEEESLDKKCTWDDSVFWECPELEEVKVPIDYEGNTFCGMKVVKGELESE